MWDRNILCISPWPLSGKEFGCRQGSFRTSLRENGIGGEGEERNKSARRVWVCPRCNQLFFSRSSDLTSLLTSGRPAGVPLPGLQPSAGQFFASLDPINEASAILSPLGSNPRNSVQHQFQDTFPGTETLPGNGQTSSLTDRKLRVYASSRGNRGAAILELRREVTESRGRNRKISQ